MAKSARSEAAGEWIQDAVKRPGRVRKYLGVGKGEKIPMRKLNAAIKRLEAKENKTVEERSLLSALLLAKRFKSGGKGGLRQEAAKPQNPRMGGPKRKHGTY